MKTGVRHLPRVLGVHSKGRRSVSVCVFLWEEGVWRSLPVWDKNLLLFLLFLVHCFSIPRRWWVSVS